jgi:DNA polymerase
MGYRVGAYQKFDPALASALDWWADAGVDVLVEEVPRDWFAKPLARAAPVEAAPGALPATLEALAAWRLGPDAPEAGWSGVSLAASGPANARLMVLVDCPDRDDGDAGALLSGKTGVLFDRMLASVGLSREDVHIAAVCAKRPLGGRLPPETAARLGEIARHQVELAAPERLLLLGNATSRAVLAIDHAEAAGQLRPVNLKSGTTQAVASHHPRALLERPACKAEAWRDLRLWAETK